MTTPPPQGQRCAKALFATIGSHGKAAHTIRNQAPAAPDHGRTPTMIQAIGADGFLVTPSHGAAIIAIGQTIETATVQIVRAWEADR